MEVATADHTEDSYQDETRPFLPESSIGSSSRRAASPGRSTLHSTTSSSSSSSSSSSHNDLAPDNVQGATRSAKVIDPQAQHNRYFSRKALWFFLDQWRQSQPVKESEIETEEKPAQLSQPVNPKGYFANERTFLSWMNLCLVINGLVIGLINFGDKFGQAAGLIFGIVGISFMFYSLIRFWARADQLSKRDRGSQYEDITGALALVAVVFLAVGINFVLHFVFAE